MNNKVRERLFELSDEKYKKFHSSLCPGTNNIIGVRVPVLRKFARELVKGNFREYLENAEDKYYEEIMLQGMVIGVAKMDIDETLEHITKFIEKIDNWAICDTVCAGLKITKNNREKVWQFIQKYLNSNKEFELRFAVVMMLDFYIEDEYIDKVIEKLDQINHDGYYVKMAVAWAISICYIKYPEKTMKYLENNNLDNFTYNKSLQKIIESYRVEEDKKKIIRDMKRASN